MRRIGLALVVFAGLASAQNQPISVSGTVLGTNGVPLRKASVVLQPTQPNVQPYGVISDGAGRFSITDVEPGRYVLAADHTGYLHANYGGNRPGSAVILSLLPGDEMRDLTIRMTEQSVITGKVVDEDGDPATRVQVQLLKKTYANGQRRLAHVGSALVDDIGEFRLSGITAGEYYLAAEPPRGAGFVRRDARSGMAMPEDQPVLTYYPGVTDPASAVPVKLTAGEILPAINIQLVKAGVFHVRGTVTGMPGGTAQERVTITRRGAMAGTGTEAFNSPIGKDGQFDVSGVPAGSWTIAAFHTQGALQVMGSRAIEVSGQDIDGLVINAVPPPEIHGVVRFEGTGGQDAGPPKLRVLLQIVDSPLPRQPNVSVDDDGKFTLPGTGPGKFRVEVVGIPPGSYLKSVKVDGRDVLTSGWEMAEGGAGNMEIVIGSPSAEIFGVLLAPDGNNAPGSVVTLAPDPINPELAYLFLRMNTDQNGRFSFRGMAPGSYRVYGWDALEAGEQYDPDLLKAHDDRSVGVTVSEGDRTIVTLTESVQ